MTATPAQIGPYRVMRELGRGGMGVVWLARDESLDRDVAIKALPEGVAKDPERLRRLRAEARIVAQLNHPHIAQIHHLLDDNDSTFLILEYIAGCTLGERIRANNGALDTSTTLRLMTQVAEALEAAHGRGVVHRDLKPDNILVTADGAAKILDFGIALAAPLKIPADASAPTVAAVHPAPRDGSRLIGTPGYMSPEQCRGEDVDACGDVFSFGCVLYECLTGRKAIRGDTIAELIASTLRDEPDASHLPSSVPDGVASVVLRCMARAADARPGSMHEVRTVLEQAIGVSRVSSSPHSSFAQNPTNLPHERDRFIGRGMELDELARLLDDLRLITLTGSGGCGKTRLAIELGRRVLPRFNSGVWFVDLAPISDPMLVASAAAATIGAADVASKSTVECLTAKIGDSHRLLILDNCEHVLEMSGALCSSLLDSCRNLKIVTTSREPLAVRGEVAWRVPSLPVPANPNDLLSCESVALFVERAREVQRTFEVGPANADAVASICRRLDGIPLAIELAAARVSVLSPEQIESRLNERFKLLRAGRGKAERHQTLRAAIDWSWRMLGTNQQRVLRSLSVFAGGCDLDGATVVIGGEFRDEFEVLDLLMQLAAKSLLLTEQSRLQTRYRLLETVRQYALEELDRAGEASSALDRHLAYFASLTSRAEPEIMGPHQSMWLDRLDADADNIMIALDHGCRTQPRVAQQMCGDLWRFWQMRGHVRSGMDACARALAASTASTTERVVALLASGNLHFTAGNPADCERFNEEALAISRELDDRKRIARSLNGLGLVAHHQRDYALAKRLFTESAAINREVNQKLVLSANLGNLAELAREEKDFASARRYTQEAMEVCRELGVKVWEAGNHYEFGALCREEGDLVEARRYCATSIEMLRGIGERHLIFRSIDEAAMLACLHGHWKLAAELAGATFEARERAGVTAELRDQRDLDKHLVAARTAMREATGSEDDWHRAYAAGRAMTEDQAIDAARTWLENQDVGRSTN